VSIVFLPKKSMQKRVNAALLFDCIQRKIGLKVSSSSDQRSMMQNALLLLLGFSLLLIICIVFSFCRKYESYCIERAKLVLLLYFLNLFCVVEERRAIYLLSILLNQKMALRQNSATVSTINNINP
jgi:hypothetical protein